MVGRAFPNASLVLSPWFSVLVGRQLARVARVADQTSLGKWLPAQSGASVAAPWGLVAEFVMRALARAAADSGSIDAAGFTHWSESYNNPKSRSWILKG